jgi:hypothetical protein
VAIPAHAVTVTELHAIQTELREFFEAVADGHSPRATVTVHQYLTKPPGRMPANLAGQYLVVLVGEWRDVVLAFACRLVAGGRGQKLKRCVGCRRVFIANKAAKGCADPTCQRQRAAAYYQQWVARPKSRKKRVKSFKKYYNRYGWTLGARGGLGPRRARVKH